MKTGARSTCGFRPRALSTFGYGAIHKNNLKRESYLNLNIMITITIDKKKAKETKRVATIIGKTLLDGTLSIIGYSMVCIKRQYKQASKEIQNK